MMHIMKRTIPKMLGYVNQEVSQIQEMTFGNSWSFDNKPDESLKLHSMYSWCLHWPMNEMK